MFTDSELDVLMNNPREVSSNPYLLFTSYALNGLKSIAVPDDDSDDCDSTDDRDMWGAKVPKRTLDRYLSEMIEDFTTSVSITICSENFTIRKASTVDKSRLKNVFSFSVDDGMYLIEKSGIVNIDCGCDKTYDAAKSEMAANREYLRKIILVAEDDDHDGWGKLTDMEAAVYCWALYWNKTGQNNIEGFQKKYKSWHALSDRELMKGWSDKCKSKGLPSGMYTFSAANIRKWNEASGQESVIDTIDGKSADDYWYDTASKTTFK